MIFLKPEYLYFMLIPSFILFYLIITNRSKLTLVFDEQILQKLTFDNDSLGRVGRNIMLFIALFFIIIALARPVIPKSDIKIKSKSIDMMVALDVSKSMKAVDIYPDRLTFAKKQFNSFLDAFSEANVGVIAFSSEGFLVSPMTQDSDTLKYLVKNLTLESMSLKGTDIMIPIEKAKDFLKDSQEKIVIIFTDGGDKRDFSKEIEKAKEYGLNVYIYAVGTELGAPIKDNQEDIKDKNGNIVISKLNPFIKELAIKTDGAYIIGGYKNNSISLMVDDIKKKFKMHELKSKKIKEYKELFYYFIIVALLFMLFAFSSLPKKSQNILTVFLIVISLIKPMDARVLDFIDIKKAKEAYKDGDFKQAQKYYENIKNSKKSAESIYDFANTQYKNGDFKNALENYQRVNAKSDEFKYKKLFNIGNAYFKLKKYEKALASYEKAKEIKTEDDLEKNIELTKKMLKKQKEKNQNKKDKKDQKKEKNRENKNNKESQDNQKSDNKKQDNQKKEQQNKNSKDKDQKKADQQKEQKKNRKISDKEIKKWQEQLEKMKPKTMPVKFQNKNLERKFDENPW